MNTHPGCPDMVIIAGPNGSGKTTVASFLIRNKTLARFVNADVIAQGLGLRPEGRSELEAGKVMLDRLNAALTQKQNVAFETTMAGRNWQRLIRQTKSLDYHVTIIYVAVLSAEIAGQRVSLRVKEGGHSIPAATIHRRFGRSLQMFFSIYQELADTWYFFDNSGQSALLIAQKEDQMVSVFSKECFDDYRAAAQKS